MSQNAKDQLGVPTDKQSPSKKRAVTEAIIKEQEQEKEWVVTKKITTKYSNIRGNILYILYCTVLTGMARVRRTEQTAWINFKMQNTKQCCVLLPGRDLNPTLFKMRDCMY